MVINMETRIKEMESATGGMEKDEKVGCLSKLNEVSVEVNDSAVDPITVTDFGRRKIAQLTARPRRQERRQATIAETTEHTVKRFQPKPGEEPHDEGYYCRTITNKNVRTSPGDNAKKDVKDQAPAYRPPGKSLLGKILDDSDDLDGKIKKLNPHNLPIDTDRVKKLFVKYSKSVALYKHAPKRLIRRLDSVFTSAEIRKEFYKYFLKGDFEKSDKIFIQEVFKVKKDAFLKREEERIAFILALGQILDRVTELARFMDVAELDDWRKDGNIGRSTAGVSPHIRIKCFTVDKTNPNFEQYRVMVTFPISDIKDKCRPLEYTQLPRRTKHVKDYKKGMKWTPETEIAVDAYLKVPKGKLKIVIKAGPDEDTAQYETAHGELGQITFKRVGGL